MVHAKLSYTLPDPVSYVIKARLKQKAKAKAETQSKKKLNWHGFDFR